MSFDEKVKELEQKEQEIYSKIEQEQTKFKNEIGLKQQWDFVLESMSKQNPELHQEIKEYFEEITTSYNNPLVKNLMSKVEELEARGIKKDDSEIVNSYNNEVKQLKQDLYPTLEKLGVKIDEEKVKQAWVKGADNAKAAVYSIYGDQINTLWQSKTKLDQARKKSAVKKTPNAGSFKRAPQETGKTKFKSYQDITRKLIGY